MFPEIIDPIDHVHTHHNESDGWIALFKKDNGRFSRQRLYKVNELDKQMSEWIGEDVYFSQNTFYKPTRTVDSIRQLRALYVDIDCHLFNLIPEYTLRKLETELFKEKVPEPNIITFSGRGLNCVWFLEPSPYQALPLWQAIEDYLVKVFKEVGDIGTDEKVRDASRVLRLAGSINSKNGEKVTVQHRHNYKYSLREIQEEYLPELTPKKAEPAKAEIKQGRPKKVATIHKSRILHFDRWNDIKKLAELRNYDLKGHRELLCFLYRYWSCFYVRNPEEALYQTIQFNAQFLDPLPEREVINATKSAEQAFLKQTNKELNAIAKAKGYPGAGYNLTNETLIGWLEITEEEQVQLKTIISKDEKKRRKKIANRELRRSKGMKTMQEYNDARQSAQGDKVEALKKLLQDNPKAKKTELAELLNISRKHLYSLLKELD